MQVADRFGTTSVNFHHTIMKTCEALSSRISDYVIWPRRHEYESISAGFEFPDIIGVVDTTSIDIKQPLDKLSAFTTRDNVTSIKVQAVCDASHRLLDVSIGWPGSMHDARIWDLSYISTVINEKLAGTKFTIAGDKAYRLELRKMTLYRDNGHLSDAQKSFNHQLSVTRSIIEITFALLKEKWRKLFYLDVTNLSFIPSIIGAACVLHNFVIDAEGEPFQERTYNEHPYEFTNDARCNRVNITNML